MSPFTRVLFVRPSFLEGMARLFDFAGALNIYNRSINETAADVLAMKADWNAVGEDLWAALEQSEREYSAWKAEHGHDTPAVEEETAQPA